MATVIKGGTAYAGVSGEISAHTDEAFSNLFAEVVFDASSALRALGVKAYNGRPEQGNVTKTTGKGLTFNKGGLQFSGKIAKTAPSAQLLAKGGNLQATERDDWVGWAYDWVRLAVALGIPEEDVQDNQGNAQLANLLSDQMKIGKMGMMDGLNKLFLGEATAVSTTIGLPYLISVTQGAGTIGGIAKNSGYWANWVKSVGSPGGGGDSDKPLNLKRAIVAAQVATSNYASANGPDLYISNVGAYLTIARLGESLEGLLVSNKVYQQFADVGIPHMLLNGQPIIHDKAATLPWGGTASTDFIYGVDTTGCGLNFKAAEYLKMEPWEAPRQHDTQRTFRANIFSRVTPYIRDRRSCFVLHGITANTEATSD